MPPSLSAQDRRGIPAGRQRRLREVQESKEGKNADYIPALAKVDPKLFGIALVTADGQVYTAGDMKTEVSIQSISKVFTMARVIQDSGEAAIVRQHRRRRDRAGVQLDRRDRAEQGPGDEPAREPRRDHDDEHGRRRDRRRQSGAKILGTYDDFAGRKLTVLEDVYKSEAETNQRNQAIGMLMYAYGHIKGNPQQATDSTRGSARSASTRSTSRRWRRRSRTAASNPVTRQASDRRRSTSQRCSR